MEESDRTPEVIVVTGGATGIGRSICEALLSAGKEVLCIDRQTCEWTHENLHIVQTDLTDIDDLQQTSKEITSQFKVIGLINNAGANNPGTVESCALEDLEYLGALHIRAPVVLTRAFLNDLKACGSGRIVNITTRAALGKAGRFAYSTTKAGLVGMTRTLALELGSYGVTVNAVAPGPIETELLTRSNPGGRDISEIPVRRLGRPEDVARAVLFFMDPQNSFVTGQVLYVCGGTSVGAYGL